MGWKGSEPVSHDWGLVPPLLMCFQEGEKKEH